MTDVIWETPAKKRQEFDEQFSTLVTSYVETYKGGQPIISWHSDKIKPVIHKDFFTHLPTFVQQKIGDLLKSLD